VPGRAEQRYPNLETHARLSPSGRYVLAVDSSTKGRHGAVIVNTRTGKLWRVPKPAYPWVAWSFGDLANGRRAVGREHTVGDRGGPDRERDENCDERHDEHELAADEIACFLGHRVTAALVTEVRARLDQAGFSHVTITVSGGLTPDRIRYFKDQGAPVDSFAVGSHISGATPIDFTGDIKEIDGTPIAKRGRIPGRTESPRLKAMDLATWRDL